LQGRFRLECADGKNDVEPGPHRPLGRSA
jgi:hypothetical protein